jgi:ferredoxin
VVIEGSSRPRVHVDRGVCVGAGLCVLAAPGVFDQEDGDGLVVVLVDDALDDPDDAVREAARRCPSGALTLPG